MTLITLFCYSVVTPTLCLQGDGRYLITNSKDQSVKLWDMRRFSSSEATQATRKAVSRQLWDYRWQSAPSYCKFNVDFSGQDMCMVKLWVCPETDLCSLG